MITAASQDGRIWRELAPLQVTPDNIRRLQTLGFAEVSIELDGEAEHVRLERLRCGLEPDLLAAPKKCPHCRGTGKWVAPDGGQWNCKWCHGTGKG